MSDTLGSAVFRIRTDQTEFVSGMRKAEALARSTSKKLNKLGKRTQRIGKTMTQALTLPLVGLGALATREFAQFEQSLSRIEGLVGQSKEQIEEYKTAILEMSGPVAKAPQELADAMFFIESAGFAGAEAMDILTASARAATAGLGDTERVADAVTSVVNAYGSDVMEAARATDVLTATVREGKLEASELSGVIGRVTPMAAELGIAFEDVGASFAQLTRLGNPAAEAATQIRGVMRTIIRTTGPTEKSLEQLGMSAQGLREEVQEKGLLNALVDLRDRVEDAGMRMSDVFVETEALQAVLSLTGENAETTTEILAGLNNAAGATDDAFAAAADTTQFRLDAALAEARATLVTLGESVSHALIPMLEDLVGTLQRVSEWWQNLDAATQQNIIRISAFVAATGPALVIVGKLIVGLSNVIGALGKARLAILALKGPIGIALAAIVGLTAAIVKLRAEAQAYQDRMVDTVSSGVVESALNQQLAHFDDIGFAIDRVVDRLDVSKRRVIQNIRATQDLTDAQREQLDAIEARLDRENGVATALGKQQARFDATDWSLLAEQSESRADSEERVADAAADTSTAAGDALSSEQDITTELQSQAEIRSSIVQDTERRLNRAAARANVFQQQLQRIGSEQTGLTDALGGQEEVYQSIISLTEGIAVELAIQENNAEGLKNWQEELLALYDEAKEAIGGQADEMSEMADEAERATRTLDRVAGMDALQFSPSAMGERQRRGGDRASEIPSWVERLGDTIKSAFSSVDWNAIGESALSGLSRIAGNLASSLANIVMSSNAVQESLDLVTTEIMRGLAPIINTVASILAHLAPIIRILANVASTVLLPVVQAIAQVFTALMPVIQVLVQLLTVVANIVAVLAPILQIIANIAAAVLAPVLQIIATILSAMTPAFSLFAALVQILAPILELLLIPLNALGNILIWLHDKVIKPVGNFLLRTFERIGNFFIKIVRNIVKAINKIPGVNVNKPDKLDLGRIDSIRNVGSGISFDSDAATDVDTDLPDTDVAGGRGATFEQARPINVTVDIADNYILGDGSIRDFARLIRDEFEALGVLQE